MAIIRLEGLRENFRKLREHNDWKCGRTPARFNRYFAFITIPGAPVQQISFSYNTNIISSIKDFLINKAIIIAQCNPKIDEKLALSVGLNTKSTYHIVNIVENDHKVYLELRNYQDP